MVVQHENPAVTITALAMSAGALILAKALDVFAADKDVSEKARGRLKYVNAMLGLIGVILAVPVAAAAVDGAFWQAVSDRVQQ